MIFAVLPAPNHVKLNKLRAELGKSLRPASGQEFGARFPDCDPGAMPPIGSLYNLPVYVDRVAQQPGTQACVEVACGLEGLADAYAIPG
jgi:Ala-tRNA(Pro) deacylase